MEMTIGANIKRLRTAKNISSKCHSKYFHRKVAELFGKHKIIKFKLRMYRIM